MTLEAQMDSHIIIAGDSNPLGFQNTNAAPYAPTVRVQIWTDTNADGIGDAWNYLRPGMNTGTISNPAAWGSEVQIANRWLADNPTGYLWIVKDAETVKGSTTLADDWKPETGSYFSSTSHAAREAMHNLDGSQFAFNHYEAAFIGLGENDATHPQMAAAYLSNLMDFNAAAREQWNVSKLVEYRITEGPGASADNLIVRQAQWQAAQIDDHLVTFKTIGFTMQSDNIHYAMAGQVALGDADYDGWML